MILNPLRCNSSDSSYKSSYPLDKNWSNSADLEGCSRLGMGRRDGSSVESAITLSL